MQNKKRWIFKKHTNNLAKLIEVALYLKSTKAGISTVEREIMYEIFMGNSMYNPRESLREKPLDAMTHRISELNYYMFGYSDNLDGESKFIFSPLGNLFLKHLTDHSKLQKIFATMLFSIQFPHPASAPSEEFKLYPFRLIFKLLLDERLDGKLYNYEIYRYIIYIDDLTVEIYEDLVRNILVSRKINNLEKFNYLKQNEFLIVKSTYEWQYYVSKLLEHIHIIKLHQGTDTIDLFHPQKATSKSKPTKRIINNGYFELDSNLIKYIKKLLAKYSFLQLPLQLDESTRGSSDVVKEIYSFYPDILLEEIGEEIDQIQNKMLGLPKLIEEYSQNPNNETSEFFEDVLEEAFNMFVNVEAKKLSGSGRTDIECMYLTLSEKFAVEAKSTSNKLSGINAGRLNRHRKIIGAKYTIVVTPRYVPSVRYDIEGQNIVIIKANTLSEYFYNNIIANNRYMDYGEIQKIIMSNLGTDVSKEVSELTLSRFG